MELSEKLKNFIKGQNWIFAKTYTETWPHAYIVQERVDNELFLELANHLNQFGYEDYFYNIKQIYFDYDGFIDSENEMKRVFQRLQNQGLIYLDPQRKGSSSSWLLKRENKEEQNIQAIQGKLF